MCDLYQGAAEDSASKKPRRSERLSQVVQDTPTTPVSKKQGLPSPITHHDSISSNEAYKEATATPPEGRPSQLHHRPMDQNSLDYAFSSPPQDTQAFSQFKAPA